MHSYHYVTINKYIYKIYKKKLTCRANISIISDKTFQIRFILNFFNNSFLKENSIQQDQEKI